MRPLLLRAPRLLGLSLLTWALACGGGSPPPTPAPPAPPTLPPTALPPGVPTRASPALGRLLWVPPGSFTMGVTAPGPSLQEGADPHEVRLTHGFYLMESEVTQAMWRSVQGALPPGAPSDCPECPVERVSWRDAQAFAAALSAREGETYRLPTEAEWEYAARGGQPYRYAGSDTIEEVSAWSLESASSPEDPARRAHPVCRARRNALGFCDMSGNVWEWVQDLYAPYPPGPLLDPVNAPPTSAPGALRVTRGGGWYDRLVQVFEVSYRGSQPEDTLADGQGLRLVREGAPP